MPSSRASTEVARAGSAGRGRRGNILARLRDDTGAAPLELVTVGVLLLVPLVYLVITLAVLQSATFAAEGAARHAARLYVQADSVREADRAIERSLAITVDDHGIEPDAVAVSVRCSPASNDCLARGALVTVGIRIDVPLPLAASAGIPIEATATQQVSRFRGTR